VVTLSERMNPNPQVEEWLLAYDNPQKDTVLAVRSIVLAADARIGERIKWGTPTFTYEGNLASFNPKSRKHTNLMFHTGARIPGRFPNLLGGGDTARYMQFENLARVEALKDELVAIVRAWCDSRTAKAPRTADAELSNKRTPAKLESEPSKTSKVSAAKSRAPKKKPSPGTNKHHGPNERW
jgi:hypothetical protein